MCHRGMKLIGLGFENSKCRYIPTVPSNQRTSQSVIFYPTRPRVRQMLKNEPKYTAILTQLWPFLPLSLSALTQPTRSFSRSKDLFLQRIFAPTWLYIKKAMTLPPIPFWQTHLHTLPTGLTYNALQEAACALCCLSCRLQTEGSLATCGR